MSWFREKKYKVFQRFYKFKGFWDRLLLITKDKKIAEDLSRTLTENGVSKDGRRDYEGIVN
jgi:predicted RNA-binding protein